MRSSAHGIMPQKAGRCGTGSPVSVWRGFSPAYINFSPVMARACRGNPFVQVPGRQDVDRRDEPAMTVPFGVPWMDASDFRDLALRNPAIDALLDELLRLELPDAWLVSGCLAQTVWNLNTGRPVGHGIDDYDVFYFDPDLSWDAENRVIARLRETSDRLGIRVEIRNQARVHLWYGIK